MAIYRQVQMTFWTDPKIVDDFTVEDRYFYLYLFTNPHTNLCGCYEISIKQMALEMGLPENKVLALIKRMKEVHHVLDYSDETKEILIVNWHKYNWTKSEDFKKSLLKEIESIKNGGFKEFLQDLIDGVETVYRPSGESPQTTVTVSVTDTVSVPVSKKQKPKAPKNTYGENGNVKLTAEEYKKLCEDYGEQKTTAAIDFLDLYIGEKDYKTKSHYLTIRRWVMDAVSERKKPPDKKSLDDYMLSVINGGAQ